MNKYLQILSIFLLSNATLSAELSSSTTSPSAYRLQEIPLTAMFTPPKGWRLADQQGLSPHVQIMVVGKGNNTYPPSMNLATEKFSGTLKDYLKIVKKINEAEKVEWKDLGPIRTLSGNANLSQVEITTQWGQIKMMHAIAVKDQTAYILTASALKEEFPKFYKDFFNSIQSLAINKDLYETLKDSKQRSNLKKIHLDLETQFDRLLKESPSSSPKDVFESEAFQNEYWKPYQSKLEKEFSGMGGDWVSMILSSVQTLLINSNKD